MIYYDKHKKKPVEEGKFKVDQHGYFIIEDGGQFYCFYDSKVLAKGNSEVWAWDYSEVLARGNSKVIAHNKSEVVIWGDSILKDFREVEK